MIKYPDGHAAHIGDSVRLNRGEHCGKVFAVIASKAEMRKWGLDEPGLMIESDYYGMVFLPEKSLTHDEAQLISRLAA